MITWSGGLFAFLLFFLELSALGRVWLPWKESSLATWVAIQQNKYRHEFWLEKSHMFWFEISYTKQMLKKWYRGPRLQ